MLDQLQAWVFPIAQSVTEWVENPAILTVAGMCAMMFVGLYGLRAK